MLRVGMYVKVYGQFKMLDKTRLITGWHVKPITDYN